MSRRSRSTSSARFCIRSRSYATTAIAIAAIGILAAPIVAMHWLSSTTLSGETVRAALILLAVVIACRWPIGLYQGVLLGAHRLGVSSIVGMAMTGLGSIGAVLVLSFVSPTIEAFFLWQAGVGLSHALVMRGLAWRLVEDVGIQRFEWAELKRVRSFTIGISGIAIIGTLLMQTDKIVLPSRVSGLSPMASTCLRAQWPAVSISW